MRPGRDCTDQQQDQQDQYDGSDTHGVLLGFWYWRRAIQQSIGCGWRHDHRGAVPGLAGIALVTGIACCPGGTCVAGGTGIGALQAVKDSGKLAVGVDSDQALIFEASDPAQANVIFTSVEKKVGESLYMALKATVEGTQEYGKSNLLGLAEGAVGISKNAYYEKLVPAEVRAEIDALEAKIKSGELVVKSDMQQ